MFLQLFIILFLILKYEFSAFARIIPVVTTSVGKIQGLRASNGDYAMYLGIPYAKVNKTNPFGASIPISNLGDIFRAYQDSIACPQVDVEDDNKITSLDCLQLNVYVPYTAGSQNRTPVLVWIHGGAFSIGEASRKSYGPEFFMEQNVILVTFNYRLGPYGFICLDIPEVPGNQGMKDQLTAMRWIKRNIESFGGDINKITLFGESAGAISVDLHLSSVHDFFFNNVIIQSATSLSSTALVIPDKAAPMKISEKLGYVTNSTYDAIIYLANVDPKLVIEASVSISLIFKPCVEKPYDGIEQFITTPWINAPMPKVTKIPILLGFNSREKSYMYEGIKPESFKTLNIFEDNLVKTFNFDKQELNKMKKTVRQFYIGDNEMSINNKNEIGDFDSDFTYIHPVQRSIRKYIDNSASNIYHYKFSYSGGRNFFQMILNITVDGAVHADELGYLFGHDFMSDKPTKEDQRVINQMTTMWANFARYNEPTPVTSDLLPIKWLPLSDENWFYLNIDSEISLKSRPYHERMAFWNLFYEHNKKFQIGYKDV